jgi:hypothetical protein
MCRKQRVGGDDGEMGQSGRHGSAKSKRNQAISKPASRFIFDQAVQF